MQAILPMCSEFCRLCFQSQLPKVFYIYNVYFYLMTALNISIPYFNFIYFAHNCLLNLQRGKGRKLKTTKYIYLKLHNGSNCIERMWYERHLCLFSSRKTTEGIVRCIGIFWHWIISFFCVSSNNIQIY